jgi:SAM-dependent methyltransferase
MRRTETNKNYWDRRWTEADSDADTFADLSIYPIKYAEMVMADPSARVLELGCGLGRVVKHYHQQGRKITGIERSEVAVATLRAEDPTLDVAVGDATRLDLPDGAVDVLLAFGLYHNLEHEMQDALVESARILAPGGRFCVTMRPDNIEMRLNERFWQWRNRHRTGPLHFHKWLVDEPGFTEMLRRCGLRVEQVHHARNMSILYRLPFLRDRRAAQGEESVRRSAGYRLNPVGRGIDSVLMRFWPARFCNVMVFIGVREGDGR